MSTALIEIQYLPSLAYFSVLAPSQKIIVEKYEHYEKQTYRNRCVINSGQGKMSLVIPVISAHGKMVISEVRIDYSQKWLNNHWRSIRSCYGNAPFFEHYAPDLQTIMFKKHTFLYDFNLELLTMCLAWLKWSVTLQETLSYEKQPTSPVFDLRSAINPKKTDQLARFYKPVPYTQVFGNTFVENLSFIDLIFCEGPGARAIIQASIPK